MKDTEDNVEELDKRRLGVAAAAILTVLFVASAVFEYDAIRKAGVSHVFRAGEEGTDAVIKDVGIAVFVHSLEERS